MEQKLYDAASKLPEAPLDFQTVRATAKENRGSSLWHRAAALAACLVLLVTVGVVTVEAQEYTLAVQFFQEYGLSAEGLTREEVKAVYRDITTRAFTYSKTAEVIADSLTEEQVAGYRISQEEPTPEDIENLWNYKNYFGTFLEVEESGIHYQYRTDYIKNSDDEEQVFDNSYLEKYDGDTLLWSVPVDDFSISGYCVVSDGVIAYGKIDYFSHWSYRNAWLAKIDSEGNLLWKSMLSNGFQSEWIEAIVENQDGSYAVISRGDEYFCLSQYTAAGERTHFQKTEVGNYGFHKAACLGDGYVVQFTSFLSNEYAKIVKVDHAGNITESYTYGSEDCDYYITDMIEFNGSIYLSAYAVPVPADERHSQGMWYEIAGILNYLHDNGIVRISSEELTPLVRENYTAVLLACDPNAGTPQEFYSVDGSLGGSLSVSETGQLLWEVESITTSFYSFQTSAYQIGGTAYVFQYAFDGSGSLVSREKTGEIVNYYR